MRSEAAVDQTKSKKEGLEASSVKKAPSFTDKQRARTPSAALKNSLSSSTSRRGESQASAWERAEMAKIRKRYSSPTVDQKTSDS